MMTHWFAQIDRARSVTEVVSMARDFLATWRPEELAMLPPHCRPGKLRDDQDIESLHGALVEAYRVSRATGPELEALQRMTSFIVRASIRIADLGSDSSSNGGSDGASNGPSKSLAPRRR